jgi:hypothetical protein
MLAFCCQQGPQQMSRRFAESPDALEMRALKEDLWAIPQMALHDVRICTFPAFPQDRSQVMTATVTVGNPNDA